MTPEERKNLLKKTQMKNRHCPPQIVKILNAFSEKSIWSDLEAYQKSGCWIPIPDWVQKINSEYYRCGPYSITSHESIIKWAYCFLAEAWKPND
jgi:hypothetical protein